MSEALASNPDADQVKSVAIAMVAEATGCTIDQAGDAFARATASYPHPRGPKKMGPYHYSVWLKLAEAAMKCMRGQ